MVSLIYTANITTESTLGPGVEPLHRCGAMWFLECGLLTTERQGSEFPWGCRCNTQEVD